MARSSSSSLQCLLDGEETERITEFLGYMIIKVCFLAAATIAAYTISHKKSNPTSKQCTPIKPPSDNDGSNFQPHKNEVIESTNQLDSVAEIEDLHNVVKELQQRKLRFQRKLLELCGLKEEQSYIVHLQRRLEDKSAEIDMLNDTIVSLQTEMKVLVEDAKECVEAKKQLEMAKKMVEGLQKKVMESNESNMKMKRRFSMVEDQVSKFPEENRVRDGIVEKKLKAVKNVEMEILKMKRRNKELELEKRELAVKLVSAQERMSALSRITVSETIAKVEEEVSMLRHNNEELLEQVEKLQKNRFDMVQELVYQRWVYACLRFEILIENRNTSLKETFKDEDLSDGIDTTTTTEDSCSSGQASSTTSSKIKKSGFIQSIKRWGRSRDETRTDSGNALIKRGLIRRFSTSMVPVKTSILRNKGDSTSSSSSPSSKTPTLSKGRRRVSFSDSVKSTDLHSWPTNSVDEKCDSRSAITMNSTQNHSNEVEAEIGEPAPREVSFTPKFIQLGNERGCNTKTLEEINHPNIALAQTRLPKFIKDDSNTCEISNTMLVSVPGENRVDRSAVGTFATLLLFLFISLVGCLYISFR